MRRNFFFRNGCIVGSVVFAGVAIWYVNSEPADAFGEQGQENEAAGFSCGGQVVHGLSLH